MIFYNIIKKLENGEIKYLRRNGKWTSKRDFSDLAMYMEENARKKISKGKSNAKYYLIDI